MNASTDALTAALADLTNPQAAKLFKNPASGSPPSPPTLAGWRKDVTAMPLWAIQQLQGTLPVPAPSNAPQNGTHEQEQAVPDAIEPQSEPSFTDISAWKSPKLWIGVPNPGTIHAKTSFAITALAVKHIGKVAYFPATHANPGFARNMLATHFLNHGNGAEWHLFLDPDVLPLFGNEFMWSQAGGDKNIAGTTDIVTRLLSHNKFLVAGLTCEPSAVNVCEFAEAYENVSTDRAARKPATEQLLATKWCSLRGILIHRSVYERMVENDATLAPRFDGDVYKFFALEDDEAEDNLFCSRARAAGFQPHVDLGCPVGRIGEAVYWPHSTTAGIKRNAAYRTPRQYTASRSHENAGQNAPAPQPVTSTGPMQPNRPGQMFANHPTSQGTREHPPVAPTAILPRSSMPNPRRFARPTKVNNLADNQLQKVQKSLMVPVQLPPTSEGQQNVALGAAMM